MVMKSTIFWDITPCSLLSVNRRFGETSRLNLHSRKISWARNQCESRWQEAYFLTLKMEARCSSETSVHTQQTTRHFIPEDGTLRNPGYSYFYWVPVRKLKESEVMYLLFTWGVTGPISRYQELFLIFFSKIKRNMGDVYITSDAKGCATKSILWNVLIHFYLSSTSTEIN
jgi:hypothetical protein